MSALLAFGCVFLSNAQVGYETNTNHIAQNAKYATALGSHEIVDAGTYSVVMGFGNKVSNNKMAFAFGDSNEVSGQTSFSLGMKNLTSGDFSYSLGISNNTKSSTSFAIGITNIIENNASNSIAIGSNIINKGYQSITIGHGAGVSKAMENNTGGIMFGSYSTKPTLFISRSENYYKTGKVGVGNVTNPQTKLHIKADDGEDADILLEPTKADKIAAIYFKDKNNSIAVSGSQMTFAAPKYTFTNAGITLGKNATTQSPEISFGGQGGGISVGTDKVMSFATGRVGIGNVTSPQAKLHIKADNYSYDGEDADILLEPTRANKIAVIYFKDKNNSIAVSGSQMIFAAPKYSFANAGITLGKNTSTQSPEISFGGANKISVGTDSNIMNFTAGGFSFATGKVGIGCENTVEGYALAVNGGVVSTRVSVMDVDAWPDYVFGSDYERMSLYELEEYIDLNHHLPEVPSAEEVSEQGIDLGEMNALLLQKVEELTLHVIELQKQIDAQQNEINELKAK